MNFNIDTYLQPISEQKLCGDDLSLFNDFHEIKQARIQDDIFLDQGEWVTEPKQADWTFVEKKCKELLINQTKDIRLLTWITEAWSHLYGFKGIENGLKLSAQVIEKFWIDIHPTVEDEDLDQRLGLLQGLISQLPILIKQVPLVYSQPFYTLVEYEKRLYQQNAIRKSAEDSDFSNTANVMDDFNQAIASTSRTFQLSNFQDFESIFEPWSNIKQILDLLMQLDAPSFSSVDSQLSDIQNILKKVYKIESTINQHNVIQPITTSIPEAEVDKTLNSQENMALPLSQKTYDFQSTSLSHLQNREQALEVLEKISQYFKENEPHSPVSYMLEKTIKWSQMPLHEWLNQVIKNENSLENIQELLGIEKENY